MKKLVLAALLTAALPAHALFFFIPGSLISAIGDKLSGSEGNHCVASSAKVGDTIGVAGNWFKVKSLSGTSTRCNNAAHPVRALLEPASSPALNTTVSAPAVTPNWEPEKVYHLTRCVWPAARVSDTYNDPQAGYGSIARIVSVNAQECGGTKGEMPHLAAVKFNGTPPAGEQSTPVPVEAAATPPPAGRTQIDRLRELKQMRDENLITQDVYEMKQREILAGQ